MNRHVRHVWGWVLVLLGITGLILPIMPGWVFLIPGLVILSDHFTWARRLLDWAKRKTNHGQRQDSDRRKTRGEDPGNQ